MSSGLFTSPGAYAKPDEMIAFGHVLKKYNAGYFTHLRDESNQVLEAVEEAIDVARQCGVHVEIVHFKCSGMDNWGKAATALKMIADARAQRPRRRLRRLSVRGGHQPAEEPAAAMGAGRRRRGDAGAAARARDPRAHRAPTSSATASTTGAASRTGTACRSRSRRTCRSTPARPSARSPRSAAPIRSMRCATTSPTTRARRACWSPRISEDDIAEIVRSTGPRWSAPTAIASRPTAP